MSTEFGSETFVQGGNRRSAVKGLRLMVAVLVVAAAAVGASVTTPTASAASAGNVWVIYGSSSCPGGGSVIGIYAAVGNTWSTGGGGDWGDNIIYPRVIVGAYNTISAQVYCQLPWYEGSRVYLGAASQHTFYASYSGQNFWF